MGSTGDYYPPLYYALKEAGIRPHVMNAYKIRRLEPNKTDKKDAIWLLEVSESELFSDSYMPDDDIQALRFLIRKQMRLLTESAISGGRLTIFFGGLGFKQLTMRRSCGVEEANATTSST